MCLRVLRPALTCSAGEGAELRVDWTKVARRVSALGVQRDNEQCRVRLDGRALAGSPRGARPGPVTLPVRSGQVTRRGPPVR